MKTNITLSRKATRKRLVFVYMVRDDKEDKRRNEKKDARVKSWSEDEREKGERGPV